MCEWPMHRKILIVAWPYVRPSVRTTGIPMQNNSINRYGKPKATRGFFGGKSQSHLDFYREKKQQQSRVFSTLFLMSSLTWITEKELKRVIKNKRGEFRWKKDMKFHSSGEKMRNASGQQGENERQWKKKANRNSRNKLLVSTYDNSSIKIICSAWAECRTFAN